MKSNTQLDLGDGIYFADLYGDGLDELLVANGQVLEVFGSGSPRRLLLHQAMPDRIERLIVGSFVANGCDPEIDQLVVTMPNGATELLTIGSSGAELERCELQHRLVGCHETAVVGDFDNDGADEILVIDPSTGGIRMIRKLSRSLFGPDPIFSPGDLAAVRRPGSCHSVILAGEFSDDRGGADLVVLDPIRRAAHRFASAASAGTVTFDWAFSTASGSLPPFTAAACGRIDGSGRCSIILWDARDGRPRLFGLTSDGTGLERLDDVSVGQIPFQSDGERRLMVRRRHHRYSSEPGGRHREDLVTYTPRTKTLTQTDARYDRNRRRLTYWWANTTGVPDYLELAAIGYGRLAVGRAQPSGHAEAASGVTSVRHLHGSPLNSTPHRLPDPWIRTQRGLTKPHLVDMARQQSGTAEVRSAASDCRNSAVVFYDARRGRQDLLFVELRSPVPIDGLATVDADVGDGFRIWQVSLDLEGEPVDARLLIETGVRYRTSEAVAREGSDTWWDGDFTPELEWLDGTGSGLSLAFHRLSDHSGRVSWRRCLPVASPVL